MEQFGRYWERKELAIKDKGVIVRLYAVFPNFSVLAMMSNFFRVSSK